MDKRNKLLIIEPEMTEPKGHFLSNLIHTSRFFEDKFKIHWILNHQFNNQGSFIPKNIKLVYSISTNRYKRKEKKILYLFKELHIFFENIFYTFFFLFFFMKEKKTILYFNALKSNYFIIPKYFKSFYFNYRSLNLNEKDHIFFPSGRRKDLALINFLSKIDINHPKFHIRFDLPQSFKFKGVFYYIKEIDKELRNNRVAIYLWKNNFKIFLKNSLSKKGIFETNLMFSYNFNFKFNRKFKPKNLVIGFLGNARRSKGFHHLPKIVKLLEQKKYHFNYLIQFSKISKDLINVKKKLYELSKKNKRLKIIEKYTSNEEFVDHLKKINIMPILHGANEINNTTSGTLYSCIPYQIPFIIPNGVYFLKNINTFKSFEKANSINDLVNKIILISRKFDFYLRNAKKNYKNFKKIMKNDPIIKNLN